MDTSDGWRLEPGGQVRGTLALPGDKSISHRAFLIAALAEGTSRLEGVLDSEDCRATAHALAQMGVDIREVSPGSWVVEGRGPDGLTAPEAPLDLGNSGTAMRLLCGLLAARPFPATLIGDASLSQRPMERVAVPLREMGARIETDSGHPPIRIDGTSLQGITHGTPVASAQVKSALLLAGLQAQGRTCLTEAVPSRDHTERMLPLFGADCEVNGTQICVEGGQALHGAKITVPRDLSAAAFFIVGALIAPGSELKLPGIGVNPRRDGILQILEKMGADLTLDAADSVGREPVADLTVRSSSLTGADIGPDLVANAIDEFPVLCVAAACAEGVTTLSGVSELRIKESDRIAAMAEGLKTLGVPMEIDDDAVRITGGPLGGGTIQSHQDHRIAMAFAIAALAASEPVTVEGAQWAATSFPEFPGLARQAGIRLHDA
ncbi:MAG: 3-phosphoshikimate 1-carboxyvinyltransferase [Gammaproteobacteria bacterium]|nr:3-phosphoshikimate 1-carboxyvinyltransferase [Gammaproteobacteria bacterium]